jgi:hypothetical protein
VLALVWSWLRAKALSAAVIEARRVQSKSDIFYIYYYTIFFFKRLKKSDIIHQIFNIFILHFMMYFILYDIFIKMLNTMDDK